ncbi:MAG: hypothetical protein ACREOH_00400 [Candidatus Entotheonellia bacterium]
MDFVALVDQVIALLHQPGRWQHQGKRAEAQQLLAPIYGWFIEGRETADLPEAKTLLATLS